MKALLLWMWLSQAADLSTTAVGLHRGCVEQTYWTGELKTIAPAKLGATMVFTLAAHDKTSKGWKWTVAGLAASGTVAAVLNTHTIPGCR